MQLTARTLMDAQLAAAVPADPHAAADNGSLPAVPAISYSTRDPSAALLPAVAVLTVAASGSGLAYSVDAATACMLLASVLRAGAWVYAAFIFAAAVLTVAWLVGHQPQQQQRQQQGEEAVQEVLKPAGVLAGQGSRGAGGLVSPGNEVISHAANCFKVEGQSCSCNMDCSPFELQAAAPAPVPAADFETTTDINTTITKNLTLTSAVSAHNCFLGSKGATCTCTRDCSPFELQHYDLQDPPATFAADTAAVDGAECDPSAVTPATASLSFRANGNTHCHQHRPAPTSLTGCEKVSSQMPQALTMPADVSTAGPVVQGCVSLDAAIVGYQRCMEVIGQLPFTAALSE